MCPPTNNAQVMIEKRTSLQRRLNSLHVYTAPRGLCLRHGRLKLLALGQRRVHRSPCLSARAKIRDLPLSLWLYRIFYADTETTGRVTYAASSFQAFHPQSGRRKCKSTRGAQGVLRDIYSLSRHVSLLRSYLPSGADQDSPLQPICVSSPAGKETPAGLIDSGLLASSFRNCNSPCHEHINEYPSFEAIESTP